MKTPIGALRRAALWACSTRRFTEHHPKGVRRLRSPYRKGVRCSSSTYSASSRRPRLPSARPPSSGSRDRVNGAAHCSPSCPRPKTPPARRRSIALCTASSDGGRGAGGPAGRLGRRVIGSGPPGSVRHSRRRQRSCQPLHLREPEPVVAARRAVALQQAQPGPVAHSPGLDAEQARGLARAEERIVGVPAGFLFKLNTHLNTTPLRRRYRRERTRAPGPASAPMSAR